MRSVRGFMLLPVVPLAAGLAGIGVFLTLFLPLNLLWFLGHWDRQLPGLWTYRAATLGDGFLLPILVSSLLLLVLRLPAIRGDLVSSLWGFLTGLTLFALWTLMALLDSSPALNWTMPQAHSLNIAGLYHAFAGSSIAGLIGFLSVLAFKRSRRWGARQWHAPKLRNLRILWLVAASVFVGFASVASVDGLDEGVSAVQTAFIYVSALVAGLVLLPAVLRIRITNEGHEVLLPIVTGTSIGLASWHPADIALIPVAATMS